MAKRKSRWHFKGRRWLAWALSLALSMSMLVLALTLWAVFELPSVDTLSAKKIEVPMKIYSADHRLMAEYGSRDSTPISLEQMPPLLVKAVIATEDARFYEHGGVDPIGLMRAVVNVIVTGSKSQGASTITMQVARNFYLSREKTYLRKFKEILLAIKIDNELSKDKILELYLNKIYFGQHAYGVYAASMNYYGVEPKQLTLPQMTMLAGLPQAPSRHNPVTNPEAAKHRRDHVLHRMLEVGFIDQATYEKAIAAPLTANLRRRQIEVSAPYVAEYVRQAIVDHYGADRAYEDGFEVVTTIDSVAQQQANQAVARGMMTYDHRHSYRGPVAHIDLGEAQAWQKWQALQDEKSRPEQGWRLAWVVALQDKDMRVLPAGERTIVKITPAQMSIGVPSTVQRKQKQGWSLGYGFSVGDVVWLHRVSDPSSGALVEEIAQVPAVQSALVALDSRDGAVVAWVGGDPLVHDDFDHVTRAWRQPGSCIKPFLLAAALQQGMTLATLINDAPFVQRDSGENQWWRPNNDNNRFNGPTTLRYGTVHSRNLVFIRLLDRLGIQQALPVLESFGFDQERQPKAYSLALGAGETTPLQLASAYSVFVSQGVRHPPYIIHEIRHHEGVVGQVNQAEPQPGNDEADWQSRLDPWLPKPEERVLSAQDAYLVYDVLKDVVQRGTGRRARSLNRPDVTGKTGTTNHRVDAWFSGSADHLVSVVWVGFDNNQPIYEYGSQIALPIWRNFMAQALKTRPVYQPPLPKGLVKARINPKTGKLATYGEKSEFEWFKADQTPEGEAPSLSVDALDMASRSPSPAADSGVASIYDD